MVDIEPKNGFGTGTHETTAMCVEALEKYIKPNCTVLDVGCGSGILSIISLMLGAKSAVGVDCKKDSVETAEHNTKLNKVDDKFHGIHGNLTDKVTGKFDVIVANILSDPIKELLPNIGTYLNDNGTLILSGIVDFRLNEIIKAANANFNVVQMKERNNWVCLELKLKAGHN
jgi:ribosomal protein L11 methyltransferase